MNTQVKVGIALACILIIGLIFISKTSPEESEIPVQVEEEVAQQTESAELESNESVPQESVSETSVPVSTTQPQLTTPTPVTSQTPVSTPNSAPVTKIPTITKEAMEKYWDLIDTSLLAITLNQIDLYNSVNANKIECNPNTFNCKEKIKEQYAEYEEINRDAFVYGWEDANQAILSTDIYKTSVSGYTHYAKDFLYFYTNKDGKRIILSYHTNLFETNSLVEATLMFTDTDFDGLGTIREKCETPYKNDPSCFVSNPDIRDTDGDGWWDGTEVYL